MKLLFILLLAISCSSKPELYKGGKFGDIKFDEDTFLVSFHGDSFSSSQNAVDMLYVRCAEIALENGYPYFIILGTNWRGEHMYLGNSFNSIEVGTKHTWTSKIRLLLKPLTGKENFDAKAIYSARLRTIHSPTK